MRIKSSIPSPFHRALVHNGRTARAGFSLVELMLAVFILAVGLTGLTHGITTSLQSSKVSEVQSMAAHLASGLLEMIKAEGLILEGEDEGTFGDTYPQFTWKSVLTETDLEGLFEVRVVILDKEGNKQHFELTTLLFDPPYLGAEGVDDAEEESGSRNQRRREQP